MTLIKTLSPKNEARIICPVFNAETRIADCFSLEQQLARGNVQPERRGCQACMRALKCPIYWINRDIQANGADDYHAAEPKVVSLTGKVLDHIRPIVVRDETMLEMRIEQAEREAIIAANELAATGAKAPRSRKPIAGVKLGAVKRDTAAPQRAQESDDVTQAAMAGDMSAAVTRAAKAAPEPAAEPILEPAKPFPEVGTPAMRNSAAVMNKIAAKPVPAPAAPAPAPAGKPLSLLELARQRATQKDIAA